MKKVAVFCGSNSGSKKEFGEATKEMARALARSGLGVVYGGGNIGLMGILADTVLQEGGRIYGVIPRALQQKELAHGGLTELHVVETMHARKALMADLSDAFIALPGGMGTLDELFETITWAQLGLHAKAMGLLNSNGYFDNLLHFLDNSVNAGFVTAKHRAMLAVENDPQELLQLLGNYQPPEVEKWIDREQV